MGHTVRVSRAINRWPKGQVLNGRYEIMGLIGTGGMGAVLHVKDLETGKDLAAKIATQLNSMVMSERFEREIYVTSLFKHPNIVQAFDSGTTVDGSRYLLMEYLCPGRDLGKIIRDKGFIEARQALTYTSQIAIALRACAEKGVVHRDLKPSNIRVVEEQDKERVVLTDFGLSRLLVDHPCNERRVRLYQTSANRTSGSPVYMAPERFKDPTLVDVRTDLYALGVSLFEMLTGELPFSGRSTIQLMGNHCYTQPDNVRDRRPELAIPEVIARFVGTLLEKELDDRYKSAEEVLVFIDQIQQVLGWA